MVRMGKGDDILIGSNRDVYLMKCKYPLASHKNILQFKYQTAAPGMQKHSDDFHRTAFATIKGEQCKLLSLP